MKIIGLIVIFFSCTAIGFIKSKEYKERDIELHEFINLLYFIKREISSYLTPQKEIFEKIHSPYFEKNGLLERIRESSSADNEAPFYKALCVYDFQTPDKEAQEILKVFARELGRLPAAEECEHCDRAIRELEKLYEKKKEETSQKIRLCQSIGSMIGIVVALLLW